MTPLTADVEKSVARLREMSNHRQTEEERDVALVLAALAEATARAKRYETTLSEIAILAEAYEQAGYDAAAVARTALHPDHDTKETDYDG